MLNEIVDLFVRQGVIVRTADPEGMTLGRPPESVAIADILWMLSSDQRVPTQAEEPGSVEELLSRRDASVKQSLQGLTLKSLSEQPLPAQAS